MLSRYLDEIVPKIPNRAMVRDYEVWIKINGQQKYLFASMDDYTRF